MSADFRLGDCIVRPQRRLIERGQTSIHIKPKSMAVLECLAAADGVTVSRNELFERVWPRSEVTDDTLTKCIVELRKALDDSARESRVIETIPKLGFRLAIPVTSLDDGSGGEPPSVDESRPFHREVSRRRRVVGLASIVAILLSAILLYFSESRSWVSNPFSTSFTRSTDQPQQHGLLHPGIAVLPFVNLSSDPENEYFSLGISEEILNALAASNRLPVIARTSSFQFSSRGADIQEIGRLLNVSHVLEGSVRKADGEVRVSAQLIDTATGLSMWAGVYQRELRDIMRLQAEIARQVSTQINTALGTEFSMSSDNLPGAEMVAGRNTDNVEAYELYLKGTILLASHDPIPVEASVEYFDKALALDANYADAWAAKGRAIHALGLAYSGHSYMPADVFPLAIEAYRRALEIDPGHSYAMGWLGVALMQNDFDWAEGLRLLKHSIDINPNNAAMLSRYGTRLARMGLEGSAEYLERALILDPFGWVPTIYRSSHFEREGRWVDAALVAESTLVGNHTGYKPNSFAAFMNLAAAAMSGGDVQNRNARLESAEAQIRQARRTAHPVDFDLDVMEILVSAIRNNTPMPWRKILDRAKTERLHLLLLYAVYGQWEDGKMVVEAFDLAIKQRDPELWLLFGPKPPGVPESEWHRMKELTGVSQFQSGQ